jgi:uncharacterized NAD(P)/FAD-binding protein YdhS
MAEDETAEGRHRVQLFLRSLQSSYSSEEIAALVRSADLGRCEIDASEAMTVTLRIEKE